MNGRRHETRFLPSTPWNAALQTTEDVMLERAENGDIWVISGTPGRQGDDLTLEVATGGLRLNVRILHSEPIVIDGSTRHRLRLHVLTLDPDDDRQTTDPIGKAGGDAGARQ